MDCVEPDSYLICITAADLQSKRVMQAIDLFSGCGGLTLGLKQAGYQVRTAIENDKRAGHVYSVNHPEVKLISSDIRLIDARSTMRQSGLKSGELDLMAGCPPCQSFSRLSSKNKTVAVKDERNFLITDFGRFVTVFRPKTLMLENVPQLASFYLFEQFVERLRSEGYWIVFDVVDAADYGVAQRRKRLVLLGSRFFPPMIAAQTKKRFTVRDKIASLPKAGCSGDAIHDLKEERRASTRKIISLIPHDGGSRSDLPLDVQLACHRRTTGFSDVYGRMRWDACAPTITSGCTNPSKGRFLHPTEDRSVTLREAALLQGFPMNYKFEPSFGKECLALMIGNALPPPLIKRLAGPLSRKQAAGAAC